MSGEMIKQIPCWILIILPGLWGLIFIARWAHPFVRARHARCPACLYNMTGVPGSVCPECGHDARSKLALLKNHFATKRLACGLILLSIAAYGFPIKDRIMRVGEPWEIAWIPSTAVLLVLPWQDTEALDLVVWRFNVLDREQPHSWGWQRELLIRAYRGYIDKADQRLVGPALNGLQRLTVRHTSAVDALCDATRHEDAGIREKAIARLGSIRLRIGRGPERDVIIATLIKTLEEEPEPQVLITAIHAVHAIGIDAVRAATDQLLSLADHASRSVRIEALSALHLLGPAQFDLMSDDHLRRFFEDVGAGALSTEFLPDAYLLEMIRRGGERFELYLESWLMREAAHLDFRWDGIGQLEVLTALRRLQGHPDPLRVEVQKAPAGDVLHVRLVNADVERRYLQFQRGGDNRGPRPERFHIEVRDADGRLLPTQFQTFNMGGISSYGGLAPDETWEVSLATISYVQYMKPGVYTARLHYHNKLQIAAEPDVSQLITSRSEWFEFVVE